jgi:hypothetical protein
MVLQKQHKATQICLSCFKGFNRKCDLDKHLKTHTRSWKCSKKDCGYSRIGFPTERECKRHTLDRHSIVRPKHKCHFPRCVFTATRESNCKQHMERAHGWKYVRTKGKAGTIPSFPPMPVENFTVIYGDVITTIKHLRTTITNPVSSRETRQMKSQEKPGNASLEGKMFVYKALTIDTQSGPLREEKLQELYDFVQYTKKELDAPPSPFLTPPCQRNQQGIPEP